MSAYRFMEAMLEGKPIEVYNHGKMARDYTYIDDIVKGISGALNTLPTVEVSQLHKVYNLGNNRSESLMDFIETLEKALNIKAVKKLLPLQQGDVRATAADISAAQRDFGYNPSIPITTGIPRLVDWYKNYLKKE